MTILHRSKYSAASRLHGQHWLDGKTLSLVITLIALFAFIFIVANAKPALSQSVHLVRVDVALVGRGYRASKLIGANVVNDKNEGIGKIDDIIIDNNRLMYAVIQVGGFLGLGSRLVVVPYDILKVADDRKVQLPGASKDELKNLAEFKYL